MGNELQVGKPKETAVAPARRDISPEELENLFRGDKMVIDESGQVVVSPNQQGEEQLGLTLVKRLTFY